MDTQGVVATCQSRGATQDAKALKQQQLALAAQGAAQPSMHDR